MAKKTTGRRAKPAGAGGAAKTRSNPAAAAPGSAAFVKAKHAPGALAGTVKKAGGKAARADKGQPGEVAIERLPEPHRSIARAADAAIRKAVPGCTSIVKWGNACYYTPDGRAFATIYQTRAGINLGLPGAGLDDPEGLLEGTGKTMRHVKLGRPVDARRSEVAALVRQAEAVAFERM